MQAMPLRERSDRGSKPRRRRRMAAAVAGAVALTMWKSSADVSFLAARGAGARMNLPDSLAQGSSRLGSEARPSATGGAALHGASAMAALAVLAPLLRRRPSGGCASTTRRAEPEVGQAKAGSAVTEDTQALGSDVEQVSGDDPLIADLESRLREMKGDSTLTLDMVLNPAAIVNAEREVILLRAELKATPEDDTEKRKEIEDKIEVKQMKIVTEMKCVMQDSLKLEFLVEAAISVPAFGVMSYGAWPWVPDLEFLGVDADFTKLAIQLFGLWGVWLVTIPALRARKPGGPYGMGYEEKRALDTSFFIVPIGNFIIPFFTKDPSVPFWMSLVLLGACYLWSFNTPLVDPKMQRRGAGTDLNLPEPIMWAIKALDFGTGSERGAVREDWQEEDAWQQQLAAYEQAAEELEKEKEQKKKSESKAEVKTPP
eukprot:TRINITY_DN24114_c0_g1_i1.p1 TRINITY_DN24114_c0_g1~~TRINITY_DN24114_c0_g1_i1.p1  ORF type:complete len:428 (+),score=114.42 TRINITY_DN24114_c0_g1_i1:83-1366(+)